MSLAHAHAAPEEAHKALRLIRATLARRRFCVWSWLQAVSLATVAACMNTASATSSAVA